MSVPASLVDPSRTFADRLGADRPSPSILTVGSGINETTPGDRAVTAMFEEVGLCPW